MDDSAGLGCVAVGDGQYSTIFRNTLQCFENGVLRLCIEICVRMDMAQNILVIRTVSGMAMAVAAALDAMHFQEVVGCIAGDDTIMCAVRSSNDTILLMDKIRKLLNSEE